MLGEEGGVMNSRATRGNFWNASKTLFMDLGGGHRGAFTVVIHQV